MGCDIHWILERKQENGKWEAVLSKNWYPTYIFKDGPSPRYDPAEYELLTNHPAYRLGYRDYIVFCALSSVRPPDEDYDGEHIATKGIPENASQHVLINFEDDIDLHSHGYFTLGDLKEAMKDPDADIFDRLIEEDEDSVASVNAYLDAFIAVSKRSDELTTILIGREWDPETDTQYPDLKALSNHQKLTFIELQKHFLPIADDTIRLVICYDN